jgi:cephalosporin hydroxylase
MRSSSSPLRRLAGRFLTDAQRERIFDLRRQLETPLLKLRTRQAADLDALARLHGTDKSSYHHGYARLYQRHFASRRPTVRRLLEIGVGGTSSWRGYETTAGGQSLRMWSDFFPNAEIVGIDIHAKAISGPRIRFEQGDQSDPVFLQALIEKYRSFDIVIDDGSHIGRHIAASFAALWSAVIPGGMYVIEDLPSAYDPLYGGGSPGTPGTAAELIKCAVDDTLLRENDPFRPSIAAMHVYGGIVFFEKTE